MWMGASEVEMLFGRFHVDASLKSIVFELYIHIEESHVFPEEGSREFNGKSTVKVLQECFQCLLLVGPN